MKRSARPPARLFALFRWVDRVLGAAACSALVPWAWLLKILAPARRPPRRILVLKFFGLGSILRAGPLFGAIREAYPRASLDLVTFAANGEVARRLEVFSNVLTVRTDRLDRLAADLIRTVARLVTGRYDVAIDLEFFSSAATFLAAATLAPQRVGYFRGRGVRERLLSAKVSYDPARHVTDVYAEAGRAAGVAVSRDRRPALRARPEDRRRLEELLASLGVGREERLVLLNVTSSGLCEERRWIPERFAWLHDRLVERGRERLAFIGLAGERPLVDEVRVRCRTNPGLDLSGRTDLGLLVALLERAALLVTNDSGPAHLADAVGTPAIVLFGPETPVHYGPLSPRSVVFHAGLACSPCLNAENAKVAPCGGRNACMKAIPAEDVLEAAAALLDRGEVGEDRRRFWRGYAGRFARVDWKTFPAGAS